MTEQIFSVMRPTKLTIRFAGWIQPVVQSQLVNWRYRPDADAYDRLLTTMLFEGFHMGPVQDGAQIDTIRSVSRSIRDTDFAQRNLSASPHH
jgi:hypothetical protein